MSNDTNDKQRIAINKKHGGFGLSDEAVEWLVENRDWTVTEYAEGDESGFKDDDAEIVDRSSFRFSDSGYSIIDRYEDELRCNTDICDVIEELGSKASDRHASLKVVEIPADVEWTIEEYDGLEWIAEEHRTWD